MRFAVQRPSAMPFAVHSRHTAMLVRIVLPFVTFPIAGGGRLRFVTAASGDGSAAATATATSIATGRTGRG